MRNQKDARLGISQRLPAASTSAVGLGIKWWVDRSGDRVFIGEFEREGRFTDGRSEGLIARPEGRVTEGSGFGNERRDIRVDAAGEAFKASSDDEVHPDLGTARDDDTLNFVVRHCN